MLDLFRQDTSRAARSLVRSPLFTAIAVLSVAIGIGATTAIFTLTNALLFKAPPGIGAPERLVSVGRAQDGQGFDNFSYPAFEAYRDGASAISRLAAISVEPRPFSLAGPDGGEQVQGGIVSGTFFEVLQARPSHGRFFLPDEDRVPKAYPVVVLSHHFWRARFNSDVAIVGKSIVLNGSAFTVVGIAEQGFQGPFVLAPDLWVPVMSSPLVGLSEFLLKAEGGVWLMAIGRLAPNASLSAAQSELGAIQHRLTVADSANYRGKTIKVMPMSFFPGNAGPMVGGFMALLLAVAGLVLLIATTNVAGMLLARAAGRQREIAVRLAIGATRSQLVSQLVTESVLLFLISAVAGVLLAHWLVAGLMSMIPRLPVQLVFNPSIDWRVLAFALLISLVTGVAAGLLPALQSTRPSLVPALKSDGGGVTRRQRLRSSLLVAQIAFSMLLLVVAGLFARALVHARSIDPGFDARGVHLASFDLQLANYSEELGAPFTRTLLERASALPGAGPVALSVMLPLDGGGMGLGSVKVAGREAPDRRRGWDEDWNVVSPRYFETMRISMARGRAFTEADRSGAPDVAILNETFAQNLWPGQDPIGKTFQNSGRTITVSGIARNSKYRSLGEDPRNFIYLPLAQRYMTRLSLLVQARTAVSVAAPVRRLIAEMEPALPILNQRSFEEHAAISLFPQRVALGVAGSLGIVALLLALLGIYGVTAFSVAQRTREIGVRVALGAQRKSVIGLIVRQGIWLAVIGVTMGAMLAFGVTRLLRTLLYGVPTTDIVAFGSAALLLIAAALAASWIPATRAADVDPVVALRAD